VIEFSDRGKFFSDNSFFDGFIDVSDGFENTFAEISGLIAISEFECLMSSC
jgi:hypothetical protein